MKLQVKPDLLESDGQTSSQKIPSYLPHRSLLNSRFICGKGAACTRICHCHVPIFHKFLHELVTLQEKNASNLSQM